MAIPLAQIRAAYDRVQTEIKRQQSQSDETPTVEDIPSNEEMQARQQSAQRVARQTMSATSAVNPLMNFSGYRDAVKEMAARVVASRQQSQTFQEAMESRNKVSITPAAQRAARDAATQIDKNRVDLETRNFARQQSILANSPVNIGVNAARYFSEKTSDVRDKIQTTGERTQSLPFKLTQRSSDYERQTPSQVDDTMFNKISASIIPSYLVDDKKLKQDYQARYKDVASFIDSEGKQIKPEQKVTSFPETTREETIGLMKSPLSPSSFQTLQKINTETSLSPEEKIGIMKSPLSPSSISSLFQVTKQRGTPIEEYKYDSSQVELSKLDIPSMKGTKQQPEDFTYLGITGKKRKDPEYIQSSNALLKTNTERAVKELSEFLSMDTKIDTKDGDAVYKNVKEYEEAQRFLDSVYASSPTQYDQFIIEGEIAEALGVKDREQLTELFSKKREEVKKNVSEYSGVSGPVQTIGAVYSPGVKRYEDIILEGTFSRKDLDNLSKDVAKRAVFENKVMNADPLEANILIRQAAKYEAGGSSGSGYPDEETITWLADLTETKFKKDKTTREREIDNIIKREVKQDKEIENKWLSYNLTTGQTPENLLSNPGIRNKYLGEYMQTEAYIKSAKTDEEKQVENLALSGIIIRDDIDKSFEQRRNKLRREYGGTYKTIMDKQGNPQQMFEYRTQEGHDKEKKLFNEYKNTIQDFSSSIGKDYNEYKFQPDEINEIKKKSNELKLIYDQQGKTAESIRRMDWSYVRDKELQSKIDVDKFTGPGGFVKNIGRTFTKDVGGLFVKGVQGSGQVAGDVIDDTFSNDYGDVVYSSKEEKELLKQYGVKRGVSKATDLGVMAGIVGLGAATGGSGWGLATATTVGVAPSVVIPTTEELGYITAPEQEKKIMRDYTTFREGMGAAWSAENRAVSESTGFSGVVKKLGNIVPLSEYIPFFADKDSFKSRARDYYSNLGYSEAELDAAVNAAARQRNWGIGGEGATILLGNIGAELVGRRAISKAILGGGKSDSFWTGFTKVGSAGIVEGMALERASQLKEYRDIDYKKLAGAGGAGFVTAGLIGGGMTWSGPGGKLNKILQKGGYLADWYEKPGDYLASKISEVIPSIAQYSGYVRPKIFTFATVTTDTFAKSKENIDVSKIKTGTVITDGPFKGGLSITMSDDTSYIISPTATNTKTLSEMFAYFDAETASVAPKSQTVPATWAETSDTKTKGTKTTTVSQPVSNELAFSNLYTTEKVAPFTMANTIGKPQSFTEYLSKNYPLPEERAVFERTEISTKVNMPMFTQPKPSAFVQPQVIEDDIFPFPDDGGRSRTDTSSNTNTNTQSQTQVDSIVNPQALAQTNVFDSILPYGRVTLPKGSRGFGSGSYVDSWINKNKIVDYAAIWKEGLSKNIFTGATMFGKTLNFKPQPTQKIIKAPMTGYDKAQSALDNLFGSNIASGKTFKQNYGQPTNNKVSSTQMKRMVEDRKKQNFIKSQQINEQPTTQTPVWKSMVKSSAGAISKIIGKRK